VKIQIVYLDPQDDRYSAQDKLRWVKTPRALLVWPRRGVILNNQMDLELLKRTAEEIGVQLGLVTFDSDIVHHAEKLGVPVFQSLEDLPEDRWPERHVESSGSSHPPSKLVNMQLKHRPAASEHFRSQQKTPIRWVLVLVTILALAVLGMALIPSASIDITPQHMQHTDILEVDPALDLPTAESGESLGRIESLYVTVSEVIQVEGIVEVPDEFATGEVVFTNLTEERILIPAGTGVRPTSTSPLRYETTSRASLPAGSGNAITLPVRAVRAGPEGNLPASTLSAIEGDLAFSLEVTNPEPITGGSTRYRSGVDEADQQYAREVAQAVLEQEALASFEEDLSSSEFLLRDHIRIVAFDDPSYAPARGTPTDHLQIELSATMEAVILHRPALESAIEAILLANFLEDEAFSSLLDLIILDGSTPDELLIRATYRTLPEMDLLSARAHLRGLPIAEAVQWLEESLPLSAAPQIDLNPSWLSRMPFLEGRIVLNLMVPAE